MSHNKIDQAELLKELKSRLQDMKKHELAELNTVDGIRVETARTKDYGIIHLSGTFSAARDKCFAVMIDTKLIQTIHSNTVLSSTLLNQDPLLIYMRIKSIAPTFSPLNMECINVHLQYVGDDKSQLLSKSLDDFTNKDQNVMEKLTRLDNYVTSVELTDTAVENRTKFDVRMMIRLSGMPIAQFTDVVARYIRGTYLDIEKYLSTDTNQEE